MILLDTHALLWWWQGATRGFPSLPAGRPDSTAGGNGPMIVGSVRDAEAEQGVGGDGGGVGDGAVVDQLLEGAAGDPLMTHVLLFLLAQWGAGLSMTP